jgi:hypothetical protein
MRLPRALAIILIILAASLAALPAQGFEGFSFTASLNPVWSCNQFEYIETSFPGYNPPQYRAEYFLDTLSSVGILLDALAAYNFNQYYLGATLFAAADLESSGTYDIQVSGPSGSNADVVRDAPFEYRSESLGAGLEFGAVRWLARGLLGAQSLSKPIFHNGAGIGLSYKFGHSGVPELNRGELGCYISLRSQFLLGKRLGVNLISYFVTKDFLGVNILIGGGGFVRL